MLSAKGRFCLMKEIKNIAILGAGSWGSTIACHLFKKGCAIRLWDKPDEISRISKSRHCQKIKELVIPGDIALETDLSDALKGADLAVFALPSQVMREVCGKAALSKTRYFVSLVKGIENGTLKRMSEVIIDEIKGAKVAVLSGPSHAEEVFQGLPTAIVAASSDMSFSSSIQGIFRSDRFRVYTNSDIVGVELAGALKNVIAIACGVSDGLGFGDNTKAALMTRGLAEISRLGNAMGASPNTFAGLAGLGDLIATCASSYSRNRNLGDALAHGKSLREALEELGMVAEGVPTSRSAVELGKKFCVDLPISNEVYSILFKNKKPYQAVDDLLAREVSTE